MAVETLGDRIGVEKRRVASKFGITLGGVEEEQVMVVGGFELNGLRFDELLTTAQSLVDRAKMSLGDRRWPLALKVQSLSFKLMKIKALILFK